MPKTATYRQKHPHNQEILDGIAKGPWANYWAEKQEEKGRSFSGVNISDVAPKPPGWAHTWARKLADAIVDANQASLEALYMVAVSVGGYPHDEEAFGFHLGMQAVGSGLHWTDDARGDTPRILVPDMQFYQGANPDTRFMRGKL